MRKRYLIVAAATLLVSCFEQRGLPTEAVSAVGGLTNAYDITWDRSTTDVPMYVMGRYNGMNVIPLDVNDAGQIVGILRLSGTNDRAFLWENGVFTDIGPADASTPSTLARAVNSSGVIAGNSGVSAVSWTSGTMSSLPGNASGAIAFGINDDGVMVGADFMSAARWTGGVKSILPSPSGIGITAIAYDVNSSGTIVGRVTLLTPPFNRPYVWTGGVAAEIPLPTGNTLFNPHPFQSRVINDAGEWIANLRQTSTAQIRGSRRRGNAFETLPFLSTGGTQSWAISITESGEIVGASPATDGNLHAVMWSSDNVIKDLGMVPGAVSSTANAMNRNGWAVGTSVSMVNGVSQTVGVIWRATGDITAPEISSTIEGTVGANGWYTSDVHVTWSVTDGESIISSSTGCETQDLAADTPTTTYTCTATNSAGLSATNSVTVQRDASPPEITTAVEGTMGSNGWYTSDVHVTLSATDPHSAIATSVGCEAQNLATDTQDVTYTCTATNGAGLSSNSSVTVKRDATPPVVTWSQHPALYDIDQHISIQCTASDAMSGLASNTCADLEADAFTLPVSAYVRSAEATDNAGNSTTAITTFSVHATLQGLANVTRSLVTDAGLENALLSKLDAALAAQARGNERVVQNVLSAYMQQLAAQAGNKVSTDIAATLTGLAQSIP